MPDAYSVVLSESEFSILKDSALSIVASNHNSAQGHVVKFWALELGMIAWAVMTLLNSDRRLSLMQVKSHKIIVIIYLTLLQDFYELFDTKLDSIGILRCLDIKINALIFVQNIPCQENRLFF